MQNEQNPQKILILSKPHSVIDLNVTYFRFLVLGAILN